MAVSERFQGANVIDAGRLSPYWGEHAARYVYALPFVDGRDTLDIACGTGYGVGLLGSKAKSVIGVDVDAEAAFEAKRECGSNAGIVLGNGLELPFDDGTFDVITSFETLEHLYDRSGFLAELGRVLRNTGSLILSTPNANFTLPVDGKPENPFHIHEYTPDELLAELSEHFAVDSLMGQWLDESFGIPPFLGSQRKLSGDPVTRFRLLGWKVFNKLPTGPRERLSQMIWSKPFYPTEMDYNFDEGMVDSAPTLVAVCKKG